MKLFAATRSKRKFNNPVSFDEKTPYAWMWQLGSERIVGHPDTIRCTTLLADGASIGRYFPEPGLGPVSSFSGSGSRSRRTALRRAIGTQPPGKSRFVAIGRQLSYPLEF